MPEAISARYRLTQKLSSVKQTVAQTVSDDFFVTNPDWIARYGERGRHFCVADTCFHLEFLSGAIEAASPRAFGNYCQWTARMLGSRGIPAHTLEEYLTQLEKHLSLVLLPDEQQAVAPFLAQGRQACTQLSHTDEREPADPSVALAREVFLAAILSGQKRSCSKRCRGGVAERHQSCGDLRQGVCGVAA